MHVDLDPDNAVRYNNASQRSNRSVRKIVNAILRSVEEADITEVVEIKLKQDIELPRKRIKPLIIRHSKSWNIQI
jgi:plasmid stability protein